MAVTPRNLWSLHTVVDAWTTDARGVNCQDMVDICSVTFRVLYTPYVTMDFEQRRLIDSEVPYIRYRITESRSIHRSLR
jgi:hypothetical protein